MAHLSLYRKYRPSTFPQVVGQDHVTRILSEQIKTGKIPHAFLFSGGRGLGKTSIARIFARELGTATSDIYEIDAASNNSVEDIRSLTENVHTLPFASKYKVYILDEVHMLSKSAWNAFLKTLEEPPAHALFMLATTELEKVPDTVKSRTQVFELKRPTRKTLATHIAYIAGEEHRVLEQGAIDLIALLGDGSYRDALSVLEKVFSLAEGKTITREDVAHITGAPTQTLIFALLQALSKGDTEKALVSVSAAEKQDIDFTLYLTLVLEQIRTILLLRYAPELRDSLKKESDEDIFSELSSIASDTGSRITEKTLLSFLDAASRMRYSASKAIPLELAILSLK